LGFLNWSFEIKFGNLCVDILANFPGNFENFKLFGVWIFKQLEIGVT